VVENIGIRYFVKAEILKGKVLSLSDDIPDRKINKPKAKSRVGSNFVPRISTVPSVPTKFQSYGYIETSDGILRRQDPLPLGFSGIGADIPGPGKLQFS
jgi:hypothetical protein